MKISRRLFLPCALLAALSSAGCAVGPDFYPPEAPDIRAYLPEPGGRRGEGDAVAGRILVHGGSVASQWWEILGSRRLDRMIEDAIHHNADLRAAEAAVRVAQANALAERGALFPLVTTGLDATRIWTPSKTIDTNAASGASAYSLYTPQVTVAFVPDVWGGTRRRIESATAEAASSAFELEAVYLTLACSVALAAIEQARLEAQVAATKKIIALQSGLLAILRKQSDQGQIALPDVVSQETAVAQAKLLLPPLERQVAQQRHLLAFLTGRFPIEADSETFKLTSFRVPARLPLSLPADLVRQRPDIRAAEASLHAANAQIGVAIANRLPQFVLTANSGTSATSVAQLFAPGTILATMAGSVAQTVFDAETLENRQRAAEAATDQALAQYRSTVLAAFRNVADVLRALEADARSIVAATAAERSAAQNIDLLRRQVEQGQASIPILLAAQQAYLQTSLARIDAQASRLADTVALYQALGGGWWNRMPDERTAKAL